MTNIAEARKNGRNAGKAKRLGDEEKVNKIMDQQAKLITVMPEACRRICLDLFNVEYFRASGQIQMRRTY